MQVRFYDVKLISNKNWDSNWEWLKTPRKYKNWTKQNNKEWHAGANTRLEQTHTNLQE